MDETPERPGSPTWRRRERDRLLDFAERSVLADGGFGWLDDLGDVERDRPRELWVTARMTHVFALAHLQGRPGAAELVEHGLRALSELFADPVDGGWFRAVGPDGQPTDDAKACYEHAFVMLAASSALAADVDGAAPLLKSAAEVVVDRFWDDEAGRCVERWNRGWSELEPYRGANSNMHTVEASLAAAAATGDPGWRTRALRIATAVIDTDARANHWRLVEHYDPQWRPLLDYNREHPADPFRPYGTTVGHWLEWARLLLDLHSTLPDPPEWLVPAARTLFDHSARAGWQVDGAAGFVYTLDWQDVPVVHERMHWVAAEAVLTADALARVTGEAGYRADYDRWWAHIDRHLVDRAGGSWWHELDVDLRPSATVWRGKPDAYHAVQATVLPDLPLSPAPAWALRGR